MQKITSSSLAEWFATPLGAYTLQREQAWLDQTTPDIFGYHAVQLGLPSIDLLRESRITYRVRIAPEEGADLRAQLHELPIETQSVDLCLLPHTLEFASNPHEILREVDRIVRPEGRILIIGFNPWSLYGLKRAWTGTSVPWNGQFVSLVRMKDWLQLLSFEPAAGKLACYIPPFESAAWQARMRFMERTGDRWWGVAGGIYMLEAVKRVQGMRIISPAWADQSRKERKFAAVANSTANRGANHLHVVK